MARQKKSKFRNSSQLEEPQGLGYYDHYRRYLVALAYQLFEWKNLPDGVNPSYLEKILHREGYIGFYNDPKLGYIVSQGSYNGQLNHYNEPTMFNATAPNYNRTYKVFNYTSKPEKDMGVIIYNNDQKFATIPSLYMFARELAETKQVIKTNINAQKTPFIFMTDDNTKLTMQNLYNQIEGNTLAIFANKGLDLDNIKHFPTTAPYVADKLNTHRNAIWNEAMTFLGLNNANLEKRERMLKSEAESNNEQIQASGNIYLKARQEACERINMLYGLDISVDFRDGAIEEMKQWMSKNEGGVIPWAGIQ